MKITIHDIAKLLKRAGKIKDKIEPLCSKELNYPSKNRGLFPCYKCYPKWPDKV